MNSAFAKKMPKKQAYAPPTGKRSRSNSDEDMDDVHEDSKVPATTGNGLKEGQTPRPKTKKPKKPPAAAQQPKTKDMKKILQSVGEIFTALDGLSKAEKMEALRMVGGSLNFTIVPTASQLAIYSAGPAVKNGKTVVKKKTKGKTKTSDAVAKKAKDPKVLAEETKRSERIAVLKASGADFAADNVRAEMRDLNKAVKEAKADAKLTKAT